ncbi:ATP-dependent Clp protease proteolytic subunit [Paracoccus sp. CPCC 101403]|uniref:ATP-dependent Clp protease proteolytic subunit n=1 Tax=Paracoccus broussonetiae TaxID=3075834 RepID=A0ABU3ECP3_9RHOB|nr:ATP-dependent Clp protease proteolytic subunit [Paracoccus sp. CPCC 101403]MDT1061896.1 ATP-dependent Clp protease proteolytic subunit [Paracoccus sp. CPCC 101403]
MRTGADLISNDELILSGNVIDDSWMSWMWDEDVFFSPSMVRSALAQLGAGRITVRINSLGGHVNAGEQIRAMLAGHAGGCRIIVEGVAASAASMILMAGAERLLSAGSHIMIHDPSGAIFGTVDEGRRHLEGLEVTASTYASVYAAASGKTPEEARKIMKAETWYGPDAAIAEGFADGLADDATSAPPASATLEAARAAFMGANRVLMERISAAKQKPATDRAARPDQSPAAARGNQQKEAAMANETPTDAPQADAPATMQAPAVTPPAPSPSTMQQPSTADVLAGERARTRAIREMAAPFVSSGRLMQADVDALVDEGVSAEVAGSRFMATMAAAEPAGRTVGQRATITRDDTETQLEGMIGAMMGQAEGPAQQFRGMRIRHLAMELAGPSRGFNDPDTIRRGMRSTTMMGGAFGVSDFAYVTTEVMNRTLQAAYQRRAATWQLVTGAPLTATDFRELHSVRFGGDFSLKPVAENGEYQSAVLADEAEGLKVERRGRTIKLTFEAVVNDDMGAFQRIPMEFAMAARSMENSMVWALIRANAALKSDNTALFHASHSNLASGGAAAAISAVSVAAARKAMWEQRAFGTKDKDDFMQVEPDRLIVPPALELVALQFATAVTPAVDGNVNPYKSTLAPSVVPNLGAAAGGSDTAWYLISSDLPPIAHAYLEGYNAPTVQTIEGMNPDAVTMNARHIFGAAAVEYRGSFKNNGA